jgi:hypothetical protein
VAGAGPISLPVKAPQAKRMIACARPARFGRGEQTLMDLSVRVSPKERTRWRVTFRRLAADAQSALRAEDPGPAEEALALIIDLACEMRDRGYFRSEDPVEAARFVVSDAAALLWESVREAHGFRVLLNGRLSN